jgi:BON domain
MDKDAIEAALRYGRQPDVRRISVEAHGASVTLSRWVRTWPERRWVEECAAAVAGVQEIRNELLFAIQKRRVSSVPRRAAIRIHTNGETHRVDLDSATGQTGECAR